MQDESTNSRTQRGKRHGYGSNDERLWLLAQQALGFAAVLALSPLMLAIALAIKLDSRGPVIFRQERPGYLGQPFIALKFRSMSVGAESKTRLGVRSGDTRITRVGGFLRKTKLDELPQFWSIAKGEMLLVGPRPLPKALDAELRRNIPGFARRYTVRPGLTSLAQVSVSDNGLDDELIADWSRRFEAELRYIRLRCVSYDLLVLMLTASLVIRKVLSSCPLPSKQPPSSAAPTQSSTTPPPPTPSATGHTSARASTWSLPRSVA